MFPAEPGAKAIAVKKHMQRERGLSCCMPCHMGTLMRSAFVRKAMQCGWVLRLVNNAGTAVHEWNKYCGAS